LTGGPWHVNLNREIKTHLGIRNPITGEVNLENPLVQVAHITEETVKDTPRNARIFLKALVEIPISLGRDARVLVNSGAEARRLAHLINPLKPSIDIVDVLKAVETEKLIPTLVINNSEPTKSKTDGNKRLTHLELPNSLHKPKEKNEMLFLETPDGEHKLTTIL
jgi:hypothetical protein